MEQGALTPFLPPTTIALGTRTAILLKTKGPALASPFSPRHDAGVDFLLFGFLRFLLLDHCILLLLRHRQNRRSIY